MVVVQSIELCRAPSSGQLQAYKARPHTSADHYGGAARNRTEGVCFAGRCLPTWLTRLGRSRRAEQRSAPAERCSALRHAPVLLGLSVVKEQQKSPLFRAGCLRIQWCSGFYPPPPRPGLVAMMVLSATCPWAHTNMPYGLPCRSRIVSGLRNLDILNSGADDWILTGDFLLTGQAPRTLGYVSKGTFVKEQ